MTARRLPELATRRAERLVEEEGITSLPVDPAALATARCIEVMAKPAEGEGVSGMLIRIPGSPRDQFVIAYATHIDNEGFQRFSIAHELGHFVLDGHCDHLVGGDSLVHYSRAGLFGGDRYEVEADHFAAGLLMPGMLFRRAMARAGSGFAAIERLHRDCRTSLTSTAIRYAQLSDEPLVVVMSTGQRIDYWSGSDRFKQIPNVQWLRKGEPVPSGTATAVFNADPGNVARCERREEASSLLDWFGDGPDLELCEDVVGLGSYGKTLTVLFAENWPDEEDEEDEDLGAWEPTFHRSRRR